MYIAGLYSDSIVSDIHNGNSARASAPWVDMVIRVLYTCIYRSGLDSCLPLLLYRGMFSSFIRKRCGCVYVSVGR